MNAPQQPGQGPYGGEPQDADDRPQAGGQQQPGHFDQGPGRHAAARPGDSPPPNGPGGPGGPGSGPGGPGRPGSTPDATQVISSALDSPPGERRDGPSDPGSDATQVVGTPGTPDRGFPPPPTGGGFPPPPPGGGFPGQQPYGGPGGPGPGGPGPGGPGGPGPAGPGPGPGGPGGPPPSWPQAEQGRPGGPPPQPGYGQPGPYGAPGPYGQQPGGYPGAQQPGYGPPPGYGQPQQGGYQGQHPGQPGQQGQPGQPQPGPYGAPPQQQWGAPPQQYGQYGGAPGYGGPGYGQPALRGDYAEWGQRAVGGLIDYVAPFGAAVIVNIILGVIGSNGGGAFFALIGFLLYLGAIGFVLWNSYQGGETGQTIGRKYAKVKLIKEDTGQPIGGGMGVLRYIVHAIEFGIGWFAPLFTPKKQTFADMVLGTVVVKADD